MDLAPVVLFVFNRPEHTLKTLYSLKNNHLAVDSTLYIYCDGPRPSESAPGNMKIEQVRKIVKQEQWCKEVHIIERDVNVGLYTSILSGVTSIIKKYNKIIVLEDDLVTSPWFLTFMNESLNVYKDDDDVACISGYIYPVKGKLPETFFLKGADCWGWATWKRAWDILDQNAEKLLQQLNKNQLNHNFNFSNSYPYTQMLKEQMEGKIQSWAILWYASAFLKSKYCLYPGTSLVQNIGIDGSGIHSGNSSKWNVELYQQKVNVKKITVVESSYAKKEVTAFFKTIYNKPSFLRSKISMLKEALYPLYRKLTNKNDNYGWSGNYATWQQAKDQCTGYDSFEILEKVKASVLKVKNGEAVYERDSVLFDKVQYQPEILQMLKQIANENNNKLTIIDYGGSLGSSYFQYKSLLKDEKIVSWNIVEQPHFVDCGKKYMADEILHFFNKIDEALLEHDSRVLLMSSVLQYLENPYIFIDEILSKNFPYILVDRTAFIEDDKERITLQRVPPSIYPASYPAWFFNENKFLNAFLAKYELLNSFESAIDPKEKINNKLTYRKGFIFKLLKGNDENP